MNFVQRLPRVPRVHGRHDYVLRRCAGRRVLHIGCVDSGILAERFARGELMHQRLAGVAAELWGVDVDAAGIAFLRSHGVPNLAVADAATVGSTPELAGRAFDVIVASELVEHLSNPGLFLDSVQALMAPGRTELVISVPNAFKYATLVGLVRGHELVHPDHNAYFSYYTLTNLLGKHGLEVVDGAMYQFLLPDVPPSRSPRGWLRRWRPRWRGLPERTVGRILLRLSPFFGDGILVTVRRPAA